MLDDRSSIKRIGHVVEFGFVWRSDSKPSFTNLGFQLAIKALHAPSMTGDQIKLNRPEYYCSLQKTIQSGLCGGVIDGYPWCNDGLAMAIEGLAVNLPWCSRANAQFLG